MKIDYFLSTRTQNDTLVDFAALAEQVTKAGSLDPGQDFAFAVIVPIAKRDHANAIAVAKIELDDKGDRTAEQKKRVILEAAERNGRLIDEGRTFIFSKLDALLLNVSDVAKAQERCQHMPGHILIKLQEFLTHQKQNTVRIHDILNAHLEVAKAERVRDDLLRPLLIHVRRIEE